MTGPLVTESGSSTAPLTFVTVVFDAELTLLELQARSMTLHLHPSAVAEIIVLDNSVRGLSPRAAAHLRRHYGALADRVQVLRTRDVVDVRGAKGWRSQQAAKLAVSSRIMTPHYVALDAKNHFTSPVGVRSFIGADGRAHAASHSYAGHPLRRALEHTLDYVGAAPSQQEELIGAFPPTATPFVFDTALVRALIADVEQSSGSPFGAEFERQELLEFFLYSGWLAARGPGIDAVIDGSSLPSPTVWPKAATLAGVEETIAEAEREGAFVFAVHRQVLARADRDALARVARFWTDSGLFPTETEAAALIRRFRRRYRPAIARTRLSERLRHGRSG